MNIVDIIIILAVVLAVLRGLKLGFALLVFSIAGFFAGLFVGSILAKFIVGASGDVVIRALLTLAVTLGLAFFGSAVGELVGRRLRLTVDRLKLEPLDAALGAIFEVITVLVTAWLLSAPLGSLQLGGIGGKVHDSKIVQELDRHLPSAPNTISRLGSLIEPNGFPRVFLGPEPTPSLGSAPSLAALNAAISKDKASVVKIEGRGCGGLVEGSGFVAASNLVITNAHVVAGISNPIIQDGGGNHRASTVLFDPNLDLAVLRASNLAGPVLALAPKTASNGTVGAVMGYPGGGNLSAVSASVLDQINAVGRNIYGYGFSSRRIYELQADVEPGNSGGPLVDATGTVIGVVFAKSQTYQNVGYALTSPEVAAELSRAGQRPVSTGACAG